MLCIYVYVICKLFNHNYTELFNIENPAHVPCFALLQVDKVLSQLKTRGKVR